MAIAVIEDWQDIKWRSRAACANAKAEIFFPVGSTDKRARSAIQAAKDICSGCECKQTCLEYAIATNQECGVWGGTTEDERRVLRRKWRSEQKQKKQAS